MEIVYTATNFKGAILRAVLAIVFGVVLMVWPEKALMYIVMSIGLVFVITGIAAFIVSNRYRGDSNKGVVPVSGIGSMLLGIVLITIPLTFAAILIFLLGAVLIIAAVGQLFTLSLVRQMGMISWVNYLFPMLIMLAGITILFNPFDTAAGSSILFGVMSIFYGITNLWNNYILYKFRRKNENEENIVGVDKDSDEVEDVTYEEVK